MHLDYFVHNMHSDRLVLFWVDCACAVPIVALSVEAGNKCHEDKFPHWENENALCFLVIIRSQYINNDSN